MAQNLSSEDVPPTQGPAVPTTPVTPFSPLTPQSGTEVKDEDEAYAAFCQLSLEDRVEVLGRVQIAQETQGKESKQEVKFVHKTMMNIIKDYQKKTSSQDARLDTQEETLENTTNAVQQNSRSIANMQSKLDDAIEDREKTDEEVNKLKGKVDDRHIQMQSELPISMSHNPNDIVQRLLISNVCATRNSNEITRGFAEIFLPIAKEAFEQLKSNSSHLPTTVATPNNQRENNDYEAQQLCGLRYVLYKDKIVMDYTEKHRLSVEISIGIQLIFREHSTLLYGLRYYVFVVYPGFSIAKMTRSVRPYTQG
mmetsp:Transcript_2414/g.4866  ORF Transcript_2414/g.4866 Transcript_2414/m.4866 type:complete len:309 (-) Transcript_2414:722-1648(-)